MRMAFPPELFDGVHWERLLARAAEAPAAALENAFGFEIHLGRPEPAADFCIVVPAGGELAAHFSDSLAACLREIASAGTFANRAITNEATMLEYDVIEPLPGSRPPPGVFWSLADSFEPSQSGELARLLAMASGHPAMPGAREGPAADAPREADWAAPLRDLLETATPHGRISQAGTFAGRDQAGVRVIVGRLEQESMAQLLDAVGWPGPADAAMDAVASCILPGMRLAIALDVGPAGVGPRLGVELMMPGGWANSRWRQWRAVIDTLAGRGWCRADKARGLKQWCGLTRLYGRQMYLLAKGINHVKIGILKETVEVKAYLGAFRRRAADVDFR